MRPSSSSVGSLLAVVLLLAAAGCDYDSSDYDSPTDPSNAPLILGTQTGVTSMPADGASQLIVVASITPESAKRTIEFTTSLGTLMGGTGSDGTTRTVTANSSGLAKIILQSATEVGTALVGARVMEAPLAAQTLEIRFEQALPNRVTLRLSALTVEDRPDSQIVVTATLSRDIGEASEGIEVTFEATRNDTGTPFGRVLNSAGVSDSNGEAMVAFSPAGSGYVGGATMTAHSPNGIEASVGFEVVPDSGTAGSSKR